MKARRYDAYADSGLRWLGEIPRHWEVRRLKFEATAKNSNVDKHSKEGEIPVRLCNYVDVYYHDRITDELPFMKATATPEEIERFGLDSGDVLLTKDSESWDDIAVPAFVPEKIDDLVCGYHLALIRPEEGRLDGEYLFYALKSDAINYQFKVSANGVTRFGLPKAAIDNALMPVPPLDEQRSICRFLDRETARIDALIEKKRRLLELLEEKRLAVITQAVTKGLDPDVPMKDSGVEWLGEVPAHWDVSRPIRYLVDTFGGMTPSMSNPKFWDGDVPWVTPKDMKANRILDSEDHVTEEALKETGLRLLPERCVLFVVRGMILAHTFPVALNEVAVTVNQDMKALIPGAELSPEYLAWFLRGVSKHILFLAETSAHGTKALRTDTWGQLRVPVMPTDEQQAIVDHIEAESGRIAKLCRALEQQSRQLQEYRSALITNAVTGKIDVRNLIKDEAAA